MTRRLRNTFYAKPEGYRGGTSIGVAEYPGFHTAEEADIAVAYAYAKTTPDDLDYPVIVVLDMGGYERLLDYDAVFSLLPVLRDILAESPTLDDLYESLEAGAVSVGLDFPESAAQHAFSVTLAPVLEEGGIDPDVFEGDEEQYQEFREDILALPPRLKQVGIEEKLSPRTQTILMEAVGQYRYLDDVPESRVIGFRVLRPMWPDILRYDEDERLDELEDLGWNITHEDDVGGWTIPSEEVLVVKVGDQKRGNARVEYHGTTLANLLSAAPHLERYVEGEARLPELPGIPDWDE